MPEFFQKLLAGSDAAPAVLSLNVQAAMGPARDPERSQFQHLVRHFLERFFHHESAADDGEGKTRMVQLAVAAGIPGLMVAVFLWPVYHPMPGWPPGSTATGPPAYWVQLNHHFFFVLYSFVATGLITVFEWDLFFPDLLDIFVLGTLPLPHMRVFLARAAAIGIFVGGFVFDANFLAPIVLPLATDPPSLPRLEAAHIAAVAASGLFAAGLVVAAQSVLLASLGERLFRKISLLLQGAAVCALVVLLLLFPVLSGVSSALLQAQNRVVLLFPPYWFLGIYQRMLDGAVVLPIFRQLAHVGCAALFGVAAVAVVAYPMAYFRRTKQLLEGAPVRRRPSRTAQPMNGLLHSTVVRPPVRRAVFHFLWQTLLRVPRYRIYLVLYGGVGVSVLIATVLRFQVSGQQVHASASPEGIRAALGIVAFWVIAGLRTAFASSGNQNGSWAFRIVHGRPAEFDAAMEELLATKVWVLLCGCGITLAVVAALLAVAPPELQTVQAVAAQLLVSMGMCVILTDAFFAAVTSIPFTGEVSREQPNLAFTLLKYFTFFPFVTAFSVGGEYLVEQSWLRFGCAGLVIGVLHLWFRYRHREYVRLASAQVELEDGEEDFPMKLGLRQS
jgi:hypothetical protein